jgi:hypothetical protein
MLTSALQAFLRVEFGDHLSKVKRFTGVDLPEADRRSFHHQQICREGVVPNFRKLAEGNAIFQSARIGAKLGFNIWTSSLFSTCSHGKGVVGME